MLSDFIIILLSAHNTYNKKYRCWYVMVLSYTYSILSNNVQTWCESALRKINIYRPLRLYFGCKIFLILLGISNESIKIHSDCAIMKLLIIIITMREFSPPFNFTSFSSNVYIIKEIKSFPSHIYTFMLTVAHNML